MFKVLNGLEIINWHTGPVFAPHSSTRASNRNDMCLRREVFSAKACNDFGHFVTLRHNFFLNRVTETWNKLSNLEIHASSVNSFKARIDSFLETAAIA